MLNSLSLFSGIGGIDKALEGYASPVAYCEIDPYCQAVLLSRMAEGLLPNAPIWENVSNFTGEKWRGIVDIIVGGFPCQDISIAGDRKGLEGERSGLFFEIMRLAEEIKPKFLFLENTKGILSKGGIQCLDEIAKRGYDARWIVKSCKEVGSPQNRERWFCLAHSKGERLKKERQPLRETETQPGFNSISEYEVPDKRKESPPPFCRVGDDIRFRVDRIKSLGNAVCVEQTREAFKELIGIK